MSVMREPTLLRPIGDSDPRLSADPQALVLASRNAYPMVARVPRRSDGMGLVAGAGAALLLGCTTFWMMNARRTTPAPSPQAAVPVAAPSAPVAVTTPVPAPLPPPTPAVNRPNLPAISSAAAPAMVFDGSQPQAAATTAAATTTTHKSTTSGTAPAGGGDDNDQFALRAGRSADAAVAQPMMDPGNTVAEGTLIPAVLETGIDTDLPGYVRAVVSRDVRSFDGSRILIPRSSHLIGQYKSGLAAGQSRAYVVWSRLIRPDGASIDIGSPGVDFAGEAGLGGKVDSHFMKRFGSAVLLSVIGGLSSASNAAVVVSGGQSAASVAAQRDTQIAPTVRVAQGQPIRVFTARDLDFSTVGTTE